MIPTDPATELAFWCLGISWLEKLLRSRSLFKTSFVTSGVGIRGRARDLLIEPLMLCFESS